MELPLISEPLSIPDVFWGSGDGVFQKILPKEIRQQSLSQQAMFCMADIRGNLTFHLLTHRRLVLLSTSLLLNPRLMKLFIEDESYCDFLRNGIIIPAMLENVYSFSDLVKILRKEKNWAEPSRHDVDKWSKFLDSIKPTIAVTPTRENRELMDFIGNDKLLKTDYWKAIGLGMASEELVKYVPLSMEEKKQRHIRQTEFWEYAAKLDKMDMHIQAQKIRSRLSIISLGVVAKSLNLHLSCPASYNHQIEEIYKIYSPFKTTKKGIYTSKPVLEESIEYMQSLFYNKVYFLSSSEINNVRESNAYHQLITEIEKTDTDKEPHSKRLYLTWDKYLKDFSTIVGLKLSKNNDDWKNTKLTLRWFIPADLMTSTAVGVLGSYVLNLPKMWPELLGVGSSFAMLFLKDAIKRKVKKMENSAKILFDTSIPQLKRKNGELVGELYGPIANEYWETE